MLTKERSVNKILTKDEKDYLLKLARRALTHYLETREDAISKSHLPKVVGTEIPERLKSKQGVFVTLKKNNKLRGCIGYIEPIKPIYQAVMENAINAAVNDWRFPPVTKDELKDIKIEISILSAPNLCQAKAEDRLTALRPMIDGVILEEGKQTATYLPQVWEQIGEPKEFLESLCKKGGWPKDAWQDEKIKLYTYQAEHFKE